MAFRSLFLSAVALTFAMAQPTPGPAQGSQPKDKPENYPVHAKVGKLTLGAENWGHGFTTPWGAYAANDFIVIEVAIYPDDKSPFTAKSGDFSLRLNRKGTPLTTQSPGMVAASMKYPDWENQRTVTVGAGSGDGDIILGRPRPVERFPGDRRPTENAPNGPIPRAPTPDGPPGVQIQKPPSIDEIVARAALLEGESNQPIAGYLFFFYKGKLKSLKSVELLYDGPAGSVALVLP